MRNFYNINPVKTLFHKLFVFINEGHLIPLTSGTKFNAIGALRKRLIPVLLLFAFSFAQQSYGQTTGDFRTNQTGNWDATATWERWNGSTWITPAPSTPTSSDGVITILNTHTVSVIADVTVDQLTINSGGTVQVTNTGVTLTIADGTGTDVTVDGLLTTGTNSTPLENIVINGQASVSGTGTLFVNTRGTVTVNGSLTVASSGTVIVGTGGGNATTTFTVSPGGSFTHDGTMTAFGGSTVSINLNGTSTIQGSGSISTSAANIFIGGITTVTSTAAGGGIAIGGSFSTTVSNGGTLNLGSASAIKGSGTLNVVSGGTLGIASTDGITSSGITGNVRTGTQNYSNGSNFTYNGTAAQVTGNGLPTTITGILTITNTSGVTPSSSLIINTPGGTLIVNGLLTPTSGQVMSGTGTLTGSGTVRVTKTGDATNDFAFQYSLSTKILTNLTVEFAGTAAQKSTTSPYGGLTINNSSGVSLGANTTVNGALTLTSGNLNVGANTLTIAGNSVTRTSGAIDATNPISTVAFTNTSALSLPFGVFAGSVQNLTMNGTGGVTLGSATSITGTLTLTSGLLILGSNNLTLGSTASVGGSPSSSSMVVTNGAGQLIRTIPSLGVYLFPVGDNAGTAEYSPVTLNFSANSTSRNIGVIVTDGIPPSNGGAVNFLSRYWTFTDNAAGTYTYTSSYSYAAADVNGTETSIIPATYNGSTWIQLAGSAASNTLTVSALNESSGLLGGRIFTGRTEPNASHTWIGVTSTDWYDPSNWSPASVPNGPLDNVIITSGTFMPNLTLGNVTVKDLIINNSSASLTVSASATLTVVGTSGITAGNLNTQNSGKITFNNDLTIANGFSVNMSNTSAIVALGSTTINTSGVLGLIDEAAFTSTGPFSNDGTFILNNESSLFLATTLTSTGSFTANPTSNTVFTGATDVTVPVLSYGNLIIAKNGGATVDMEGDMSITGNFAQNNTSVFRMNNQPFTTRTFSVAGSFTLSGSPSTFQMITDPDADNTNLDITGDLIISGSSSLNMEVVSSSGSSLITVGENFTATSTNSSIIDFGTGTVSGNEVRLYGDFSKSGTGKFATFSTISSAIGFNFNKTGLQTFSYTGTNSDATNYDVSITSTLKLLTGLTLSTTGTPASSFLVNGTLDAVDKIIAGGAVNGIFELAEDATLKSSNVNGIVAGTSGSISNTISARTFSPDANYEFYGSSAITTHFENTTMNDLKINNSAGVTLSTIATVNGNLDLTLGVFNTTFQHLITVSSAGTSSEGSGISFVDGPIRKIGAMGGFVFPTGNAGKWARIAISSSTTNEGQYTSQYHFTGFGDYSVKPGLDHVSTVEYWTVDRSIDTVADDVTLYFENGGVSGIISLDTNDITIAHYDNADWEDLELKTTTTGTPSAGTVTNYGMNNFSPMTFGTPSGFNPLPVKLISFTAKAEGNNSVLNWSTATEKNNDYFAVERSTDGVNFIKIGEVNGAGNSMNIKNYSYTDYNVLADGHSLFYYRLKQVDFNSKFEYTKIVTVNFTKNAVTILTVQPNPFADQLSVNYELPNAGAVNISILDAQGRTLASNETSAKKGVNSMKFNTADYAKGLYFINVNYNGTSASYKTMVKN